GDGPDGRDGGEAAQHLAFYLRRHEVAAVGAGTGAERLFLQCLEAAGLAGADIGVEGALVLPDQRRDRLARAAERRPARIEGQPVEPAPGLVERRVDAGELLLDEDVDRAPGFQRAEALIVGLLEGLEGTREILEGRADIGAERLRLRSIVHARVLSLGLMRRAASRTRRARPPASAPCAAALRWSGRAMTRAPGCMGKVTSEISHRSSSRMRRTRPAASLTARRVRKPMERSEEHTSELQSRENLVCRLLLEKKKKKKQRKLTPKT